MPPNFPPATIVSVERLSIPASLLLEGSSDDDDDNDVTTPPMLERTSSIYAGKRILSFGVGPPEEQSRVWLHRKVRSTPTDGTVRLGYMLQQTDDDKEAAPWKVAAKDNTVQMVEVRIEDKVTKGLEEEFAALQWMAQHCSEQESGLLAKQVLIGTDADHFYCLQPYSPSCMSLASYMGGSCSGREDGTHVPELEAKRFFRNIVRGIETMSCLGVFHGCINIETIVVMRNKSGTDSAGDCRISELGACRHITEKDVARSSFHQMPQFIPPEVWNLSTVPSGSDLDLWAAGVVLYMLTAVEPFFSAPVLSDPIYASAFLPEASGRPKAHHPEGAADLVQRMLRYNRKERLSLQQIKDHAWFRDHS